MDELEEKIKSLSRYRIEYFLKNPQATKAQYSKEIKERISTLVQCIPIAPGHQAQVAYFTGKILNLNPEFDQNAVDALNKALKLDVNNQDARLELGKLFWKKQDIAQALTCFKEAVEKSKDPRSFCYYAAALRNKASSSGENKREQLIKLKESIDLSKKATEIDPNYSFAWYSLGNCYLCRFFLTAQLDAKDLDRSIDSFNTALQQTSPSFINPDLHVNLAEALTYKQDYPDALTNLTRAIEIEPHFETALERLDLLRTFLFRLNDCITRKGRLPSKKIKEMITSIDPNGYVGIYPDFTQANINDLVVGANEHKFACLKIVGVISHSNQIPFTMVGVDSNEEFVGITVFNFSNHFKALVGDFYVIPTPLLIHLKDVMISEKIMMDIKLIRVDEPQSLCRNGTKLGPECKALTNVRFGLK